VAATDLARADPLPRVIAWLDGHPAVVEALGGAGRVGAGNAPPYPRLRVTDPPGGDDRRLLWLISTLVQVEAYGDLDGTPGKAALRRILYVALGALAELPEQDTPAGGPVITDVRSSAAGGWSPLPSGQPRYIATVQVWTHPAPVSP
jgi:hypothetical protein